jgi:HD-GYP domain-containing protein (c-di-GMP phosphodiesterase class II)
MIRISDIIKMGPQGEPNEANKERKEDSLLNRALKRNINEGITQLYDQGVGLVKDIFDKARKSRQLSPSEAEEYMANSIDFKAVSDYLRKLIERILLGNGEFFDYFYTHRKEDSYLYTHSLNVCLLAVKIGIWMDMNKSDLMNIALGALLHDLGLIGVEEIISLPRQLKNKEMQKVNKHSVMGAKILEKVKDITQDVMDTIKGHHKRFSEKDFINTLNNEKLQKMAQIIGLADIYEAITHPRSYRPAKLPHEAIKELVEEEANNFQNKIIRSLIDNIGIYPIGSWVRLTSGEVGIVSAINKGYPLRPRINILFDSKGNKLNEVKSTDLLNEPHLHIESPVDIDKNKKLIDKLKYR